MLDKLVACVLGSMTSMASVTIEEKRLRQLKQQLFGKEQPVISQTQKSKPNQSYQLQSRDLQTPIHSVTQTAVLDQLSLKTDLIKIVSFSLAALAIQFSLFFASRQSLTNLFR